MKKNKGKENVKKKHPKHLMLGISMDVCVPVCNEKGII